MDIGSSSDYCPPLNTGPWHLTKAQIQHFDRQGYVLLPGRLPAPLLTLLKDKADQVHADAHAALKLNTQSSDLLFTLSFFKSFLNRVLHFHLHGGFDSLVLLGCPQLLAAAESLCGRDFVATVDMMVFKHKNNDAPIPWHQDLIYRSDKYRVATAGIYLEDANAGDGALQLIPSSANKKQNICAIVDNPPSHTIEIPAKAGDILIHNPMMVHCSDNISEQQIRRTLYYEFRPLQQVMTEGSWPDKLIHRRLDLMATALSQYAEQFDQNDQFELNLSPPWQFRRVLKDLTPLYLDPVPFDTANFCRRN